MRHMGTPMLHLSSLIYTIDHTTIPSQLVHLVVVLVYISNDYTHPYCYSLLILYLCSMLYEMTDQCGVDYRRSQVIQT